MKLIRNQSGQGLAEYMILLLLIAIASIVVVKQLGGVVRERVRDAKEKIVQNIDV